MNYNTSILGSGIKFVSCEMVGIRSAAINIAVGVGSRYENDKERGISHFLEHMAFKGTKNFNARQIAEYFDNIGGYFNAYTSRETTVYHVRVLSEYIEKAIIILADIIQNSIFEEIEINKEKGVINQEIAQALDDPDDLAVEKLFESSFKDQAIGRSILGTEDSIKQFTRQDFIDYMHKHYTSNNIVISIAGGIKHVSCEELLNQNFNNISKGFHSKIIDKPKFTATNSLIQKDLEQATIALAFEGSSYMNLKEYYTTQILSIIFGSSSSSRLFQEIRENRGLAYSTGSFLSSYKDTGIFVIHAGASSENIPEIITIAQNEIEKIKIHCSDQELIRAKAQIKSSYVMAEERSAHKAEEIGRTNLIFNRFIYIDEVINIIDSINIDDVVSASKKIFSSKPALSIVGKKIDEDNILKLI